MELRIDIERANEIAELFRRAPEITRQELERSTWEAELLLQREIQERTPRAHGTLAKSITAQEPTVLADNVIGVVGTPLNYAEAVELGTKPHMPPLEPLIDWVKAKLPVGQVSSITTHRALKRKSIDEEAKRVAEAIRWHIAHHGTPAFGMFHRAKTATERQVQAIFRAGVERIVTRMAHG